MADENKKLRELLTRSGVTEEGINAYVQPSPTSNGMDGWEGLEAGAVQTLEQALLTRKCCTNGTSSVGPQGACEIEELNDDSARNNGQSSWNSNNELDAMQPVLKTAISPSPNVSHNSNQLLLPHQRPSIWSGPNPDQASNENIYSPQSGGSFNQPIHQHTSQNGSLSQSSSYNSPITANVNSCVFATDMITTMAGGDPSTIREELGCVPGMDCEVDNTLVFNVMGRYTGENAVSL